MKQASSPPASSTPGSALALTDLNFFVPDPVEVPPPPAPAPPPTLNYLCAVNHNALPNLAAAEFGWNWIEPDEASQYSGAVALNRHAFAFYLDMQLLDYVGTQCWQPVVKLSINGLTCDYDEFALVPSAFPTPNVEFPTSGSTILKYSWSASASDECGAGGVIGSATLQPSFNMDVTVEGNKLVIEQNLKIYAAQRNYASSGKGNVVDRTITDTYTLSVDAKGQIQAARSSVTKDNPNASGSWLSDIDEIKKQEQTYATSLTDIPLSTIQSFVFPGGETFKFCDVTFSKNQDLVSHITYADVSKS